MCVALVFTWCAHSHHAGLSTRAGGARPRREAADDGSIANLTTPRLQRAGHALGVKRVVTETRGPFGTRGGAVLVVDLEPRAHVRSRTALRDTDVIDATAAHGREFRLTGWAWLHDPLIVPTQCRPLAARTVALERARLMDHNRPRTPRGGRLPCGVHPHHRQRRRLSLVRAAPGLVDVDAALLVLAARTAVARVIATDPTHAVPSQSKDRRLRPACDIGDDRRRHAPATGRIASFPSARSTASVERGGHGKLRAHPTIPNIGTYAEAVTSRGSGQCRFRP